MPKKPKDDLKAKQKRQKIIAAVGGVILVALLAVEVPKTMSKLHQKPPPLPGQVLPPNGNPAGTTTPSLAAPTLGSGSASGTSESTGSRTNVAAGNGPAAALAVYEVAPQAQDGQLPDFGRFVSKDPFAQQGAGGGTATGASPGTTGGATTTTTTPAPTPTTTPKPKPTPVPTTPKTPSLPASSAKISVNGATAETVSVGNDFPTANPLFHLVSATTTSAKVAIARGSYADGRSAVTLKVGKPVTLQNTADGTRYTLVLEPPV
jgi:serine/threonine-protein kinase